MSSARTLIPFLQSTFKDSPATYTKHKENTHKKLAQKLIGRVFNDFPPLLPDVVLRPFEQQFVSLLTTAKPINSIYTLSPTDEKKVQYLIHDIVNCAMHELMEFKNGDWCLQKDILQFFEWEAFEKELLPAAVICSFVEEIMSVLGKNNENLIPDNQDAHAGITSSLNANYRKWTETYLEVEKAKRNRMIAPSPDTHAVIKASLNSHYKKNSEVYMGPDDAKGKVPKSPLKDRNKIFPTGLALGAVTLGFGLFYNNLMLSPTPPPTPKENKKRGP